MDLSGVIPQSNVSGAWLYSRGQKFPVERSLAIFGESEGYIVTYTV